MIKKNCNIIRELLPLYAENLVSEETASYINEHLVDCEQCLREWEMFKKPLSDPLSTATSLASKNIENRFFGRMKKTISAVALLLVLGGAGLVYASYNAGKHIGLNDPVYRFAQELDLFTEIKQTKTIGDLQVTLDKGLFDSTRSVLFISLSDQSQDFLQVSMSDENGNIFEQKSGRGWQNKYFMLEFAPLEIESQEINVSLVLDEQCKEGADFTFPVDVVKTAQYTTIIYPNQKKELPDLTITLEKAVLGVSETEFKVRFDWPIDGSVAGLAFDRGTAYFPTSVREAPKTPPPPGLNAPPPGGLMSGYASSCLVNYRPQDLPLNRPALYDLSDRTEVEVDSGEYRTTQFPCQVVASLKFAPVSQSIRQMELLLPPLYIYKRIEGTTQLRLDFANQNEININESISFAQGEVLLKKAWLEEKSVYLTFHIEAEEQAKDFLPHFELLDSEGGKQGILRFDREKEDTIIFSLFDEETQDFYLNVDSIGQPLPREKFMLELQE